MICGLSILVLWGLDIIFSSCLVVYSIFLVSVDEFMLEVLLKGLFSLLLLIFIIKFCNIWLFI